MGSCRCGLCVSVSASGAIWRSSPSFTSPDHTIAECPPHKDTARLQRLAHTSSTSANRPARRARKSPDRPTHRARTSSCHLELASYSGVLSQRQHTNPTKDKRACKLLLQITHIIIITTTVLLIRILITTVILTHPWALGRTSGLSSSMSSSSRSSS